MSGSAALKEGQIVTGPMFNEPMQVETVRASGPDIQRTLDDMGLCDSVAAGRS